MTRSRPPADTDDARRDALAFIREKYRGRAETRSVVTPRCMFAAGKPSFEALVRLPDTDSLLVKQALFSDLPLEENGWNFETAKLSRVGSREGWPIWRLERGQ